MSPTTRPPAKVTDTAVSGLEVALGILETLGALTKNIPYLGTVMGVISSLIALRKEMQDHKERAENLLHKIGTVAQTVAEELQRLQNEPNGNDNLARLELQLKDYAETLLNAQHILTEWTTYSTAKKLFKEKFSRTNNFDSMATSLEAKMDTYKDKFTIAQLSSLGHGLHQLDQKMITLVDNLTKNRLEEWLKPAKVDESRYNAINKRHDQTGTWLLRSEEYQQWLQSPPLVLWIYGPSGTGKTVLCSLLIEDLHVHKNIYAFFFFDTNNSAQQSVSAMLKSLVFQLSLLGAASQQIVVTLMKSCQGGHRSPNNKELLYQALVLQLQEFQPHPVYLLVDALDECAEIAVLLEVLGDLLKKNFNHVHILLTSQPRVCDEPCNISPIFYDLAGNMDEDIDNYIDSMLATMGGYIAKDKFNIKAQLLQTGDRMFRLIALKIDALKKSGKTKSQVKHTLSTLPTTISAMYMQIMEKLDTPMASAVWHTVSLIMVAQRGLAVEEILDALAVKDYMFDPDERLDSHNLMEAMAGLVTIGHQGMMQIAHASVAEFFAGDAAPQQWRISPNAAQSYMAQQCVGYLRSNLSLDPPNLPFQLYALSHWGTHIRQIVGSLDAVFVGQVLELLKFHEMLDLTQNEDGHSQSPLYITVSWGMGNILGHLLQDSDQEDINSHNNGFGSLIQLAARAGSLDIVQALIAAGADVNLQGWDHGTALQAAAWAESLFIVQALIATGADVNLQGGEHGTALQAAALVGSLDIVQALIAAGADVNLQGGYYGTAVQAAVRANSLDIVQALIAAGADVNLQGCAARAGYLDLETGLQSAAGAGSLGIVQALIAAGADVNLQGGEHGTALQAAALAGSLDIVQALIDAGADVNLQGGEHGTALQAAAQAQSLDIVQVLISAGTDVNLQGGEHGTALQAAALVGSLDIVQALIDAGADVNLQGGEHGTALQAAALVGSLDIVQALIAVGADINLQGGVWCI
ncbi:NACHT domain protein [Mycena kentingensis (nom. inval.)]|nr:NACHT domain protein [Mycena kentingensis (nom. inval.)]